MDYSILNKTPNVADAVVSHFIDANGSAVPASASTPQPVAPPAVFVSTQAQTVTAGSAYTSGNTVGGLLTFAGATRAASQGGILQGAILRDKAGQNVSYDLLLFNAAPTAPTDKTAVALSAADLAKCIGSVAFTGAVLGAASTMGVFTSSGIGLPVLPVSGTTLYGILVTRGTPTYASTTDVSVDLLVLGN